jgi:ATP-binding cassette subfamily B protein
VRLVGTYARALGMVWQAAPGASAVKVAVLLVQGVTVPAAVWLMKEVVDAAAAADAERAGQYVLAWTGVFLAGRLADELSALVQSDLNERVTAAVELRLMARANSLPDLTPFEQSAFYDELQTLVGEMPRRPLNLMMSTGFLVPGVIASVGLLYLLGGLAWWLPPLLVAATVPTALAGARMQEQSFQVTLRHSPLTRAMRYFARVVTTAAHAKEVRLFGLGPFFEGRYADAAGRFHRESASARRRLARPSFAAALAFGAVFGFALWWVAGRAAVGALGLGDVVLLLQGVNLLAGRLGSSAQMTSLVVGHLAVFDQFFRFLDHRPAMAVATPGRPVPRPLREGIVFEKVSYRYPDGTLALDDVSLSVRPGERVALVGENGAGKSTLVKLLCRLYDPTEGRVLVDGTDLRELDLTAWRLAIGAVFQDFGRYQLTVAENVALGRIDALVDRAALERAAAAAGLDAHLDRLAGGLDTQLGVELGGVDLSGGQWQTLGIARALVRDADLLILDEPTAALDPRAEQALFGRFAELSAGRTTLLVTHRLGSVRMADRVLVLKGGRLVENGSHAELLERGGEYAALWRMQAEQYQGGAGGDDGALAGDGPGVRAGRARQPREGEGDAG